MGRQGGDGGDQDGVQDGQGGVRQALEVFPEVMGEITWKSLGKYGEKVTWRTSHQHFLISSPGKFLVNFQVDMEDW